MTKKKTAGSVVKTGGVAKEPAEIEDVTRDTYGEPRARPVGKNREDRIAEADRAAAAEGIPGVAMPDATESDQSEKARDEAVRRAEISGDRIASRHDAAKIHPPNRGK